MRRVCPATLAAVAAYGFALLLLLGVVPAPAHTSPMGMRYDAWCCRGTDTGGDCSPIPARDVKAGPNGWEVTLRPGDHPLVTKAQSYIKPYGTVRTSTDGRYHACLYPNENTLRCLYVPPMGF